MHIKILLQVHVDLLNTNYILFIQIKIGVSLQDRYQIISLYKLLLFLHKN